MRMRRRIIMCQPIAAAVLLAANLAAMAGQGDGGLDLFGVVPGPPSAESGKPMIGGSPQSRPAIGGDAPCAPPLPCGTRLLGSVRKNGAVELRVPALRW